MRLAKVWSPVNLSGQHQAAGDFASFLPGSHLRKVTDANALALSLDPSSDTAGCVREVYMTGMTGMTGMTSRVQFA